MNADEMDGGMLREEWMGELLRRLSRETTSLVLQEVQLAKAELAITSREVGTGVGMLGAGALFGLASFGALSACIILALSEIMSAWIAALILTLVYAGIAWAVANAGQERIKRASPRQAKAASSDGERPVSDDPAAMKASIEQTRARIDGIVDAMAYRANVKSRLAESMNDRVDSVKVNVQTGVDGARERLHEAAGSLGATVSDATSSIAERASGAADAVRDKLSGR